MGLVPGLTISVLLMLCYFDHTGSNLVQKIREFFAPLSEYLRIEAFSFLNIPRSSPSNTRRTECGSSASSPRCSDGQSSNHFRICRDMGCCFANYTCYKRTMNQEKMMLSYGILTCLTVLVTASTCSFLYIRKLKQLRAKTQQLECLERKMNQMFTTQHERCMSCEH